MKLLFILALLVAVGYGAYSLRDSHWFGNLQTQADSDLTNRYAKYLLIADGEVGRGSASIITLKGNPLLVTNVHVVSGNTNTRFRLLNSQEVTPDTVGVPEDRDILVASQRQIKEGLEACTAVDTEVAIGDAVVVLGNSQGSNVVTEIKGKVLGIGPDLVETDAQFVQGNSGSPIIHVKTGKVIAIATFATIRKLDALSRNSQFGEVRRFGYRLDTISKWRFLTPQAFSVESAQIAQLKQRTDDLITLARDLIKNRQVSLHHFDENHWVGHYMHLFARQTHGVYVSPFGQRQPVTARFPEFCASLNDDMKSIQVSALLPYHQHEVRDEVKMRTVLAEFFNSLDWGEIGVGG